MKIVVLDHIQAAAEGPGKSAYFSSSVIDHLRRKGHDVQVYTQINIDACSRADVVWTEWCNELAFEIAGMGICRKLVIRMRGYDVWYPLEELAWENVSALVYESELLRDIAEERFPDIKTRVQTCVMSSGLDLGRFAFKVRERNNRVVMAARADHRKGHQVALLWAKTRPDLEFHVACALDKHNPRLMRYLQEEGPTNFRVYAEQETASWVQKIDPAFALSTSSWEDFGYTIAESMAMGCKPLIYAFPGSEKIWPADLVWRDFAELDALVAGPIESEKYRAYVQKYDAVKQAELFCEQLRDARTIALLPAQPEVDIGEDLLEQITDASNAKSTDFEMLEKAVLAYRDKHAPLGSQHIIRRHLALSLAVAFTSHDLLRAHTWAIRALHDGPAPDVFACLGEIMFRGGEIVRAYQWYALVKTVPTMHEPVLLEDLLKNVDASQATIRHTLQEIRKAVQEPVSEIGVHALVIQTSPRENDYFQRTLASLERAGAGSWDGPKLVIADGYTPVAPGWTVIPSATKQGGAETFFRAMRTVAVIPGISKVTLFEDDVEVSLDGLRLIRDLKIDSDLALMQWSDKSVPLDDPPKPSVLVRNLVLFAHFWAVTIPARSLRLLASDVWRDIPNLRGGGDLVARQVLLNNDENVYGIFHPHIAQHFGDESSIGNSGERISRTYQDDATTLIFDSTGEYA